MGGVEGNSERAGEENEREVLKDYATKSPWKCRLLRRSAPSTLSDIELHFGWNMKRTGKIYMVSSALSIIYMYAVN